MNSNLVHTIGSNDAQILISVEKSRNFLHVRLPRYFGQMFCGSTELIKCLLVRRVLYLCPLYTQCSKRKNRSPTIPLLQTTERRTPNNNDASHAVFSSYARGPISFLSPIAQIKLMFSH